MPSREALPIFVGGDYALCPDFEGHRPGHDPHRVHPYSPFDREDWEAKTYWAQFTDYLQSPHIEHFQSVPELISKLEAGGHRDRSRLMRQAYNQHLGEAATFWQETLELIAGVQGVAP